MIVVPDVPFPTVWSGRTAVVTAVGEIDLTNAESLRDTLLSALDDGALGLVADLTATSFLDSAGVSALVKTSRRAGATGATVRIAVTSPAVVRVLDLVGVNRLMEVYPGVAEAVASLPEHRAEPQP